MLCGIVERILGDVNRKVKQGTLEGVRTSKLEDPSLPRYYVVSAVDSDVAKDRRNVKSLKIESSATPR
jgi:hypothetical protein